MRREVSVSLPFHGMTMKSHSHLDKNKNSLKSAASRIITVCASFPAQFTVVMEIRGTCDAVLHQLQPNVYYHYQIHLAEMRCN